MPDGIRQRVGVTGWRYSDIPCAFIEKALVRKLFIVLSLLPVGWPSLAAAWECDPAVSRGACGGGIGQKYSVFDRSAVRHPVSSKVSSRRILVNEPTGRDNSGARSVSLEQTTNPARAHYTPFSGIFLAMGDESASRQGRLDIYRATGELLSSRDALQMARAEAGMPDGYFVRRAVQDRDSRFQPGVAASNDGGDKMSAASPSLSPASQPGNGALLIAGFLGMCAVARRRISSIPG
jgi:hypothetical protein